MKDKQTSRTTERTVLNCDFRVVSHSSQTSMILNDLWFNTPNPKHQRIQTYVVAYLFAYLNVHSNYIHLGRSIIWATVNSIQTKYKFQTIFVLWLSKSKCSSIMFWSFGHLAWFEGLLRSSWGWCRRRRLPRQGRELGRWPEPPG